MAYTVKDNGFVVPEWGPFDNDYEETDQEYIYAKLQFERAIVNKGANVPPTPVSDDSSGDYGDKEFSDSQLIIFYAGLVEDYELVKKVMIPFFKETILVKIQNSVTEYIKATYDPNDDKDGTTKEQEDVLIKGLERYLAKLKTDDRDAARALDKISDLEIEVFNEMFWPRNGVQPHEDIINLFFEEQFEGGSDPGSISEAEKLQLEELGKINLATGEGDAEHDKGILDTLIDGGKDLLNNFLPGWAIPEFARKTTTVDLDDLEESQVEDVRQCILISDMLNPPAGMIKKTIGNGWSEQYMKTWHLKNPSGSHPTTGVPFDERILPITVSSKFDPNTLINHCTVSKNTRRYLEDDDALSPEMFYKLYWVYSDGKGNLKESEIFLSSAPDDYKWYDETEEKFAPGENRAKQIRDSLRNGYGYSISKVDIEFKGNDPSTARKDMVANITIELDNMKSIDAVCAYGGEGGGSAELKIYDLVTLPTTHTVETKKSFNGGVFKNEFHPDYTRIRLKTWCYEGGTDPDKVETALLHDLTCIKHELKRSDDGAGRATLVIQYRGYWSAMMDMLDNDALAPPAIISARYARRQENAKTIRDHKCDTKTRQKILKVQAEYDRIEALHNIKTGTLVREMFKRGLMFGYNFDEAYVESNIVGTTLPPNKNFLQSAEWLGNITIKPPDDGGSVFDWVSDAANSFMGLFNLDDPSMNEEGDVDAGAADKGYPHYGFFLGDLMYVAMDCLYKDGTAQHHEWVKNMNMRFMVTSVPVPDPNNTNNLKLISPLAIPIDLKLFTRWFHEKVVKPGRTSYPVGQFMKDLIERLVNGVIYDSCFASQEVGEDPPQLVVGYFTDHSKSWKTYNDSYHTYNPGDDLIMKSKPTSIVGDAKCYCVIYLQNPAYVQQMNEQKKKTLKDDPYTLPFYYGSNRKSVNYITNVSFTQTSGPGNYMREARHAETNFGNLNLLANVYNLKFTVQSPKAITAIYPGTMINFILTDWAPDIEWEYGDFLGESDPHKTNTKAQILGFGGYYTVSSVKYTMNLNVWNDFKVEVDTRFTGNDGNIIIRTQDSGDKPMSEPVDACKIAHNKIVEQIQEFSVKHGMEADVDSKIYETDSEKEAKEEKEEKEKEENP